MVVIACNKIRLVHMSFMKTRVRFETQPARLIPHTEMAMLLRAMLAASNTHPITHYPAFLCCHAFSVVDSEFFYSTWPISSPVNGNVSVGVCSTVVHLAVK